MSIENDIKQVDSYSELTPEKVLNIIKDVFYKDFSEHDRIYQGCKTNGFVFRDALNLNVCNDPECTSCRKWDNAMKQELKKLNLVK